MQECLAPNLVAEAARDLGVDGRSGPDGAGRCDGARRAETDKWDLAAEIGAKAGGLDKAKLLERARSPEIEARARASTAEFHALQVTQRPTFVVDSEIGDRAIFSGFAKLEPIAATIDAMLDDLAAYAVARRAFRRAAAGVNPVLVLECLLSFRCDDPHSAIGED